VGTAHSVLTDEAYHQQTAARGMNGTLKSFAPEAGGVTVVSSHVIPKDQQPSMASAIVSGDLLIERTQVWGAPVGYVADGSFALVVTGMPVRAEGTTKLTETPGGTIHQVDGKVDVKVPFVGGKIEEAVAGLLQALLAQEAEFTTGWLAK
jgi:hypothetical protein